MRSSQFILGSIVWFSMLAVGCEDEDPLASPIGSAGISVSRPDHATAEDGTKATFTVVLRTLPRADVTVHFFSNNEGEGKVDRNSLTFTPENWSAPQSVVVTGVDDMIVDGNQPYSIVFKPTTSRDAYYAGITPRSVALENIDDDSPGIVVGPISGETSEAGGQATFMVLLTTQPAAPVTLHLHSDNQAEGTVDPAEVTFTMDDWKAPQTVRVTGVDDGVADGDQTYHVVFGPTTSLDERYAGLMPDDIEVVNADNDTAGFVVSAPSGDTNEGGAQATFSVALRSKPTADVVLNLDSMNKAEGTVDKTQLTFTAENWSDEQVVTVTGVDDERADGNQPYEIGWSETTSDDASYAAITPDTVSMVNRDNDSPGITVSAVSGDTGEDGTTASFTLVLVTQPAADVTVNFHSDDATEGQPDRTEVLFTGDNWNTPQTVTLQGVDDDVPDSDQLYRIVFDATTSDDEKYAAITPSDIVVTNVDDDSAGFILSPISGDTTESGGTATFTVKLRRRPSGDVIVHYASSDDSEGTTTTSDLTFVPDEWDTAQTVTVTGVDDDVADGTQSYLIEFATTTGDDPEYNAIKPNTVAVKNEDDDIASIVANAISGHTTESGGTATFTVQLTSEPLADVTVHFDSNNADLGTVDETSLTFTSSTWYTPQTVTVTGVDDDPPAVNGAREYAIVFTPATSDDSDYAGLTADDVAVIHDDSEMAGAIVSLISGNTSESGDTATFTVKLSAQPSAEVTLHFDSADTTEGTVDVTSLVFDSSTWNIEQTVTVTGVDDSDVDCDAAYVIRFTPATSTAGGFAGLTPNDVKVVNTDDEGGVGSGVFCLNYEGGGSSDAFCGPWRTFTDGLTGTFSAITMSGSANETGKTCSDSDSATAICNALRTGSSYSVLCEGNTWQVGTCGDYMGSPGMELSVNAGICICPSDPEKYSLRPCLGNVNIGGIGTATCGSPPQLFKVRCER